MHLAEGSPPLSEAAWKSRRSVNLAPSLHGCVSLSHLLVELLFSALRNCRENYK